MRVFGILPLAALVAAQAPTLTVKTTSTTTMTKTVYAPRTTIFIALQGVVPAATGLAGTISTISTAGTAASSGSIPQPGNGTTLGIVATPTSGAPPSAAISSGAAAAVLAGGSVNAQGMLVGAAVLGAALFI